MTPIFQSKNVLVAIDVAMTNIRAEWPKETSEYDADPEGYVRTFGSGILGAMLQPPAITLLQTLQGWKALCLGVELVALEENDRAFLNEWSATEYAKRKAATA